MHLGQKQSSHTHPEEEWGCGHPPEAGAPESWFKSRTWGSSSRSLSSFGQLPYCIFDTWPDPGPSLICVHIFWPRWIQERSLAGRWSRLIMGWSPLSFWPRGVSLCTCSWRLPGPEGGEYVPSWSFVQAGLSPSLILSSPLFSKCTEDKYQLLSCACCYCYLDTQTAAGYKCLSQSPPVSCSKECT